MLPWNARTQACNDDKVPNACISQERIDPGVCGVHSIDNRPFEDPSSTVLLGSIKGCDQKTCKETFETS